MYLVRELFRYHCEFYRFIAGIVLHVLVDYFEIIVILSFYFCEERYLFPSQSFLDSR